MWRGVSEQARNLGIDFYYFTGEEFQKSPQAILYRLVSKANVDGVIFWNSFTTPRIDNEEVAACYRSFEPLPVVSIERDVPGYPSISLDNGDAVRELITHLWVTHGYRKIGFITEENNVTAAVRCNLFFQEMDKLGLLDKGLVGSLADLDSRGFIAGVDYHALIVHSDYPAVDVVRRLRERGVRVPEDVAVVGFNDGRDARGSMPPLTTIRLPFRRMGRKAAEMLAQSIDGRSEEMAVKFPVHMILRRSCGCLEPLAEQAIVGPSENGGVAIGGVIAERKQDIVNIMSRGLGPTADTLGWEWAEEIFDLMIRGILQGGGEDHQRVTAEMLQGMYDLLWRAVGEGMNVSRWHEAITVLRRYVVPHLEMGALAHAEDLFQQVRVLIGQAAMRSEVQRNWQSERRGALLREIESELLFSLDFKELLANLARGLERLGIVTFYLVMYEGPVVPDSMARLVLAYRNGRNEVIPDSARLFQLSSLLPRRYLETDTPFGMLIEALHVGEEQIGYIVFHTDPPADVMECEIFKALQIQLSSAVKGVRLRERLYEALREAEEANLLKSRFLSMVSHELRTPLNLIVGLSEMAMRQQEKGGKHSLEILRKYHEQIYVSGQHLDRLIRDVLDLASSQVGQMKLICKSIDLVPVLQDVVVMGEQLAEQKNLKFLVSIPATLPMIWADKTRIRQVILNLLSNAVKFTAHGEVALSAAEKPDGIHIVVRDTGLGVSVDEQNKIFDEFQQSDRSMGQGYSGMGLGLAITRRLVEMHGGSITVSSPGGEGSGSTFEVVLPAIHDSFEAIDTEKSSRDGKVFVVTSQVGAVDELVDHLTRQGFRVEELVMSTSDFDIEDWIATPPGAVVLDMAPASEMGWEIIKRLKENPITQDIPVLFYSLMVDQDRGTVVEMDYLNKPIGIEELVNTLRRHGLKAGRKETTTILIVDDEPGILEMHTQIVRSYLPESRILTARDGVKALDILRATRIDLVLLDLLMPELDGFGVIKSMQEEPALRGIPVIVLSGQVLTKREMLRLNQGVAAVLGKGLFSTQEVLERIERVLSRSQRLGSDGQRLVFQAMGYIHEHFKEPISRADIAGHLSVNEQYLSRCFNKEIGIGPMAYLSRYRIEQAKGLLEEGKFSITQVALEVGLSSQSYFSRIFLQETGISPSAYQRGRRTLKS
jgi:signal transduction histidine kinase/DNA-binding LacI/PurR family transcriptional regulator/DNA-binding response OmpR family regulator